MAACCQRAAMRWTRCCLHGRRRGSGEQLFHALDEQRFCAACEYPTTSVTILKFKDGRVGKVASVIDCLQPYYFHVHLVGSEGSR